MQTPLLWKVTWQSNGVSPPPYQAIITIKNYTSWPDVLVTTGQPVNLQVLADRNPTSWSASGLASGLNINNSGVIAGSVSSLSAFTATVTASNADGNDSKSISFGVSKG